MGINKNKMILSVFTPAILSGNIYAKEPMKLNKITVTAQKTEQNVQDVPISMSVFDELEIEDKRIESIADIAKYTPSLVMFDIGSTTEAPPSIRGLYTETKTLQSTMGIYVDGVPMTMGIGINDTLMDIERIEVLKGPQGTLYGKNTEAGVINIISKKPNNKTKGKISLKVGNDHLLEYSGSISGAIIKDKLYLLLSAKHYEKDGFVKNTKTGNIIDDKKNNYGKIHLRATPNDKLDISLIKSILKYDDKASSFGPSFTPNRTVSFDLEGKNNSKNDLTSLKVDYNIDSDLKLQSITSHREFDKKTIEDFDFSSDPTFMYHQYVDDEYTKISQELRLSSKKDRFDWLVGLYADKVENKINEFTIMSSDPSFAPRIEKLDLDTDSIGVFFHSTYSLSNKLNIITGLRYDDETKSINEVAKNLSLENKYSEVSPKLSFEYHNAPNIMSYFTVAKGYRAGGFNPLENVNYQRVYDKETLWSYDLGFKSSLLEDRVIFNANLYFMDIDDMQVNTIEKIGDDEYINYTSNAAEAKSKGLEVDFKALLNDNFSLFGGLGLNETKFDTFKDDSGDHSGNYSRLAPKYSFNLGITYRDAKGKFVQVDTNGYGKMYLNKQNTQPRDSYSLVNAKIGYEKDKYDIYLYANNIFDKKYDLVNQGNFYDSYSKPREIGIQVNYKF